MSNHRDLLEETRRRHRASELRRGDCAWCLSLWPCIAIRLADALEQAERNTAIAVALADEQNVYWQIAQTGEARADAEAKTELLEHEKNARLDAERRVAELQKLVDYPLATINALEQRAARAEERLTPFLDLVRDLFGQGAMSVHRPRDFQDFIWRADEVINNDGQPSLDYLSKLNESEHRTAALSHDLEAARAALETIRQATNQALPSEQTGPEWEWCARVPIARLAAIDAAVAGVLGEPVITNEVKA